MIQCFLAGRTMRGEGHVDARRAGAAGADADADADADRIASHRIASHRIASHIAT
jgi:hypothetical protein